MAVKVSTGLINAILGSSSLKEALDGGRLNIYSGPVPQTANESVGAATLLCTVTDGGTGDGLNFDTAAIDGVLSKSPSQVWQGTNVNSGVASFFRFVAPGDDGSADPAALRIQGSVAVLGGDLNLSNVSLVTGAPQAIQFFYVALPGK